MSRHCFICDLTLEGSYEHCNIFSSVELFSNEEEKGTAGKNTLFEILAQVLNRPLNFALLHSQVLCQGCHLKVIEYVTTHNKLQKLESDLTSLFNQTLLSHPELDRSDDSLQALTNTSTVQLSHKNENLCSEFNNTGQLNPSDLAEDISSEVVDEAGKQVTAESVEGRSGGLSKKQENFVEKVSDVGKEYVCGKCGKIFNANSHWVEHMLIHIDMKPHNCSQCRKQFRTLSSLKVHERSHTGVKPYECKMCGKFFSERHYLTEHLLVHAEHKAFKCSVCTREFSRRKDMMTHMKIHSEDRPYSCPECPKKFVVRSRLNRHLKTHSMDRPYQCKTCLKSFVRHNDFKVHERLHTGVKPYKCASCNRCFSSLSNCRAHERRHKLASKAKTTNGTAPVETGQFDAKSAPSTVHGGQTEVLLKRDNVILSGEINPEKNHPPEIMTSPNTIVFTVSSNQPDELNDVSDHMPPLANFDDETANKHALTPNSALPVDSDLSNVTLSSDEQNINCQQSLVLMQFPLLPDPPPLLLYSTPRNFDNSVYLASSIPLNHSTNNILSNQTQTLRWDNGGEGDSVNFYNDTGNSNWSVLAHSLF